MPDILSIEEMVATENWNLAREVISTSEDFSNERDLIENEFEVSMDNLGSIIDLPHDRFENLKKRLLEIIKKRFISLEAELYQQICIELDYCNAKKEKGWRITEYIAAVFDILLTGGATALAILAIKTEYLDKLCGCKTEA